MSSGVSVLALPDPFRLKLQVTTPFINAKFILEYMGLKAHPLYSINGLVIFLGWIAGRLYLFGSYFAKVSRHW